MDLKKDLQNEPEMKHVVYMEDLVCDCCGEKIMKSRFPVCVMNPYECVCMECFRAEYRENSMAIQENANNYTLRRRMEAYFNKYQNMLNVCYQDKREFEQLSDAYNDLNFNIEEELAKAYELALKSDSASAIEIIRDLQDKLIQE